MIRFYLTNTFLFVGEKLLKITNYFLRTRMHARRCKYSRYLLGCSPCDVHLLELVETSEGTSSLHHGHEAFVSQDLSAAVNGALVLDAATGGHHHTSPDSINGVGHQTSSNSHSPAEEEGKSNVSTI